MEFNFPNRDGTGNYVNMTVSEVAYPGVELTDTIYPQGEDPFYVWVAPPPPPDPTPTPTPTPTPDDPSSSGTSKMIIVYIAVAVFLVIMIVCLVAYCCWCSGKKATNEAAMNAVYTADRNSLMSGVHDSNTDILDA